MKKTLALLIVLSSFSFIFFAEENQIQTQTDSLKTDFIETETSPQTSDSKINESSELNEQEISDSKTIETTEQSEQKTENSESIIDTSDTNAQTESTDSTNQTDSIDKSDTTESDNLDTTETDCTEEAEASKPVYKPLPFAGMDHPEVERFRKQYLSTKWLQLLYNCLENAMEYRLFVRQAIAQKEMPEILEYLPVVESNYKTTAKSRSGALGMWQFMTNSVYPFLTLNDYVDQRLDPWASTDAALKKLTDNYNFFNDWLLAIAAYNCGVGAMNRVLRKAEKKDFWYLVDKKMLPKQTAEYVPKLLAIADLAINAEYYGIDLPNHNEEFELLENEKNGHFDYVTVSKAYSLNTLAQSLRIEPSTLKKLNPSYHLGFTHPSKKSDIRLPLGMKEAAEEALAKQEPIDFPVKYKVVAGDSLWSISRRYNTTVDAICELNGIRENAILKIGKILYIPSK